MDEANIDFQCKEIGNSPEMMTYFLVKKLIEESEEMLELLLDSDGSILSMREDITNSTEEMADIIEVYQRLMYELDRQGLLSDVLDVQLKKASGSGRFEKGYITKLTDSERQESE